VLPNFFTYISNKAIVVYCIGLLVVTLLFFDRMLPFGLICLSLFFVISFFSFSDKQIKSWSRISPLSFESKLFSMALILRVIYVIVIYFVNMDLYGVGYEAEGFTDNGFYHEMAVSMCDLWSNGEFNVFAIWSEWSVDYSDMGYPFYLGFVYFITGKSILISHIIKALLDAFSCLLIYRLAKRNFGDQVGRMAGVFYMLNFLFFWWCGSHMKETEMIFLTILFIERMDAVLREPKLPTIKICLYVFIGAALYFFRSVLCVVAFLSVITAIVMSSKKIIGMHRKIVLGGLLVVSLFCVFGNRMSEEVSQLVDRSQNFDQEDNLKWRAERKGGNVLVSKISKSVFAPFLFVIPFPTMSNTEQLNQEIMNGGYYIKNILGFFCMFGLFCLIRSGDWRKHVLLGSFLIGYLLVLSMSAFVHSGRFHMPALPFILIFAAYGVLKITSKQKRYFTYYLVFELLIIIAWNWFKLAGRGMA